MLDFADTSVAVYEGGGLPEGVREVVRQAADRARASRANNTLRAYRSDWADFLAFCQRVGFPATPSAEVVAVYIDQLARGGAKVSTIRRRIAAVNAQRRADKREPLSVRDEPLASVLRGIRREVGAPPQGARPLELDELREVVAACPDTLQGKRDRALLLLGFAGAFRRSELAGLDWDASGDGTVYLATVPEGLRIFLKRSKTNQTGEAEEVAICRGTYASTCPVRAVEDWRAAVFKGETQAAGPVFQAINRHGKLSGARIDGGSVARIVRAVVARAALGGGASAAEIATALHRLSGHSLRSGLVTTAFAAGLASEDVMRQTRHRDLKTLLGYRRHATAFIGNVSGRVGL
jgi:integrase